MRTRVSPAFVVAMLALVLASGGVGYAAGKITSAQIKDGTIQSRDIRDGAVQGRDLKNGTITGDDVEKGSLPRAKLDRGCGAAEVAVFGGCVRRAASGPTSHQAAIDDCSRRNGRLPTTAEIKWIAAHVEYSWADGNPSQYEFTADYTAQNPFTPIAFDRAGNAIANASAFLFWHHCVTY